VFYMQNSLFSNDPAKWKANPKIEKRMELDFQESVQTCDEILKTISTMEATSTAAFKDMQDKRNQIKSQISSIVLEVQSLNNVQEKLESAKKGLSDTEEDRKKYSNFKTTQQVSTTTLEPATRHSTFCMQHVAENIVCHDGCGLEYVSQKGASTLSGCSCMNNNICTVCPGRACGVSNHFHDKKTLVKKEVEVEQILHDVKAQYEHLSTAMNDLQKNVDQWTRDLAMLKAAVKDKLEQIKTLCAALKKICSRFNFVAELKSVLDLMSLSRSKVRSSDALLQLDESIKAIQQLANDFNK